MTTNPHLAWDLELFWIVSPKVSDIFVGNSTSMTSTKFHELDDQQPSHPVWDLEFFLDGLTESVRLF